MKRCATTRYFEWIESNLMDVDLSVRVVAFVGEFAQDLTLGAGKVTRAARNGVHTHERFIRVGTFPSKLSRASIEIDVGTFANPHLSMVDASTEFVVVSDLFSANLVVDGIGKGPRLPGVDRGLFIVGHDGAIGFNNWLGPLLRNRDVGWGKFKTHLGAGVGINKRDSQQQNVPERQRIRRCGKSHFRPWMW